MRYLKVQQELAQATIDYLGTRPYREVFQLIEALRAIPISEDDFSEAVEMDGSKD